MHSVGPKLRRGRCKTETPPRAGTSMCSGLYDHRPMPHLCKPQYILYGGILYTESGAATTDERCMTMPCLPGSEGVCFRPLTNAVFAPDASENRARQADSMITAPRVLAVKMGLDGACQASAHPVHSPGCAAFPRHALYK